MNKSTKLIGLLCIMLMSSCARFPLPPSTDEVQQIKTQQKTPKSKAEIWTHYSMLTTSESEKEQCKGWEGLKRYDFPMIFLLEVENLKCENLSTYQFNQRVDQLAEKAPLWARNYLWESFEEHPQLNIEIETRLTLMALEFIKTREEQVQKLKQLYQKWEYEKGRELSVFYHLLEETLIDKAPRYSKEITSDNIYEVARDFQRIRNFDKARELYNQIINDSSSDFEQILKSHQSLAQTYRLSREMKVFNEKTQKTGQFINEKFSKDPSSSKVQKEWFSHQVSAIRSLWTQNETAESLKRTQTLLAHPKANLTSTQQAQLYWLSGLMAKELGDSELTLKYLKESTTFDVDDTSLLENIYWSYFWELYEQKKNTQALDFVQTVTFENLRNFFSSRVYFWSAQIYRNSSLEKAIKFYRKSYKASPLSYYGVLSSLFINDRPPQISDSISKNQLIAEVEWLLLLRKNGLAKELFNYKQESTLSSRDQKLTLHYYHQFKDYRKAMRRYHQIIDIEDSEQRYKYLWALYPRAWNEEVQHAADYFELSSSLIFSIIRQESAFDDKARSWADAFGLMQLIPERAEALSKKYDFKYESYEDLYEPKLNIMMGSALIHQLREIYDRRFIFYVPAYNAGRAPVDHWIKTRYRGNALEFIENIPYQETRGYVRHILRNILFYQSFESQKNSINFEFLESINFD